MFVVVDTSVLIAAFFNPRGLTARLLAGALPTGFLLCVSEAIITESRRKLRELKANREEIDQFERALRVRALVVDDTVYTPESVALDDHVLGCIQRSSAELVVTNDKRLIARLTALGIAAVRPSQFQAYFPEE